MPLAKIKRDDGATCHRLPDGKRQDIDAADLVRGDVVFLEAGDNVPADLRIVSADNLRIEESALTGGKLIRLSKLMKQLPTKTFLSLIVLIWHMLRLQLQAEVA